MCSSTSRLLFIAYASEANHNYYASEIATILNGHIKPHRDNTKETKTSKANLNSPATYLGTYFVHVAQLKSSPLVDSLIKLIPLQNVGPELCTQYSGY